jgi:hypothetical protein
MSREQSGLIPGGGFPERRASVEVGPAKPAFGLGRSSAGRGGERSERRLFDPGTFSPGIGRNEARDGP